MGCCAGFKNIQFTDKEIIVNLGPKEIENYLEKNEDLWKESSNLQSRKPSSQSMETNVESPIKAKKRKKSENCHNRKIKEVSKNLKLIAVEEIKNMHKFFDLK